MSTQLAGLLGLIATALLGSGGLFVSLTNRAETRAKASQYGAEAAAGVLKMAYEQTDRATAMAKQALAETATMRAELNVALAELASERQHRVNCEADLRSVRGRLAVLERPA